MSTSLGDAGLKANSSSIAQTLDSIPWVAAVPSKARGQYQKTIAEQRAKAQPSKPLSAATAAANARRERIHQITQAAAQKMTETAEKEACAAEKQTLLLCWAAV